MMLNFDDISLALPNMSHLSSDKLSAQASKDGNPSKNAADEKSSVLIFGEDREIRFLLRTIIELWNYDCEEADSIEAALRLVSKKTFALVLMDTKLQIPDSFAEMRAMKKFTLLESLPFILLSGHAQSDVRLLAIAAGAADFFVKPINLDLLEETIKTRISESERIKQNL